MRSLKMLVVLGNVCMVFVVEIETGSTGDYSMDTGSQSTPDSDYESGAKRQAGDNTGKYGLLHNNGSL